jgi:hypothetical protein
LPIAAGIALHSAGANGGMPGPPTLRGRRNERERKMSVQNELKSDTIAIA